jgi:hypothetical protein
MPLLGNGFVNTFSQQPNRVTAATDTHATRLELLEEVLLPEHCNQNPDHI